MRELTVDASKCCGAQHGYTQEVLRSVELLGYAFLALNSGAGLMLGVLAYFHAILS